MNLTVPEVAARLRCNHESVRRLINAPGGIRAAKIAGRWLVTEEDLAAYEDSRANRPKPRQRRRRAA
ncbi:MAG: helix-turn-helix domain-containing protein [Mycobacteriaceae bacterium]